ncbi:hypothetical protein Mterra_03845 [Calidithermus terrae]|uniref:Uncharacterized protein n=1 Tax=Calidithermus terrae TaxID=1408545 RepID=A0A399DX04_9DEIN|nr:hypothetical protein [Calidithermus terrae]RIH76715.1 hypothetical protein Mterra_03845 [Calidithermus terrae]
MEPADSTYRWLRVEQPQAAEVLTDPKAAGFLFPFLLGEHSPSSAARLLGVKLNVLMYWVRRFLAHGLLEHTRTEPRGGRAVRYYRAVANAFFVPFKALSRGDLETFLEGIEQPFQQALKRARLELLTAPGEEWGLWLSARGGTLSFSYGDAEGERLFNNRKPQAPATLNLWVSLDLDFEQAKAFQHELIELYQKYAARGGGQTYRLQLAMLPDRPA